MKYEPGDKVLLLHSQEEGEVVEILDQEMVLVEVQGIRFPVYTDQIDFPYFKRFTEKKPSPPKAEKPPTYLDQITLKKDHAIPAEPISTGVWLSFLPVFDKDVFEDEVVENFKIYLINQTKDSYQCDYRIHFRGSPEFGLLCRLAAFSNFYIHNIPFEELNDSPKFEFDFTLEKPDKKMAPHFETTFKIKAKQLFRKIEEIKMKNEPTFSFILFEKYPYLTQEVVPEYHQSGELLYDLSGPRPVLESPRSVIDLHIEKLTDHWKGLSNFEILTIQLNYFEKYYQLSVAHFQPNLIVIHGIGTGKLRNEIHEILKTKKEVRTFANQYHQDFGFGATEIFFQYK